MKIMLYVSSTEVYIQETLLQALGAGARVVEVGATVAYGPADGRGVAPRGELRYMSRFAASRRGAWGATSRSVAPERSS